MKEKVIKVDYLTRVEGEASLSLRFSGEQIYETRLKIFEPPRFFEAFLRDRHYLEVPDITARICGICPVAYQLGSAQALEKALRAKIGKETKELRRLLYCGEWIESHALHVFLLHLPDFLGYQDAISLAKDYPEWIKTGLEIKKLGNEIVKTLGGREIHPVNVRVGGFYRIPEKKVIKELKEKLEKGLKLAQKAVDFIGNLNFPEFERDYEFVALSKPDEYAITNGRLISNKGLNITIDKFPDHFIEEQVNYSNALHCRLKERGEYLVGPLARFNLNYEQLTPEVKKKAEEYGLKGKCFNPFKSIIIRSLEILYAFQEAIRISENYQEPKQAFAKSQVKEAEGSGCTEAPRGICWHNYQIGSDGLIKNARIVPPTSQNQKTIEKDLFCLIKTLPKKSDSELKMICEQAIRNHDPCISCATHFLKLEIER